GATLVPIPNTIVKPYSADGTPLERARESRPSPAPPSQNPPTPVGGFCAFYRPIGRRPLGLLPSAMPKAGIVTVVGKPNAGKSTLLNRLVGEKLSIVSPKPQSTRDRIVGIRTEGETQLILLDTPGLLNPRYPLQQAMRGAALAALYDADVILYLVDPAEGQPGELTEVARLSERPRAPIVLAINKIDLMNAAAVEALRVQHPEAELISASTGAGIESLLARINGLLPDSPFLYPDDEISTQTTRFFVSELIRETAFEQLEEEIPYSVACEIEEFRESQSPVYI